MERRVAKDGEQGGTGKAGASVQQTSEQRDAALGLRSGLRLGLALGSLRASPLHASSLRAARCVRLAACLLAHLEPNDVVADVIIQPPAVVERDVALAVWV